jgi:hypothetical protein
MVRKPGFAPGPSRSQREMLLLHHDPDLRWSLWSDSHPPSREATAGRADDYEFTKLVLWLLRHRGKMVSAAGLAPTTSTFARWRSDLTELRGQNGIRDRTCTD